MNSCSASRAAADLAAVDAEGGRDVGDLRLALRQELVQRRVEQADRDGEPGHRAQDAGEVLALHREDPGERLAPSGLVGCEDHAPHGEDAVLAEEHVLRAAEADAFRAEGARSGGVLGGVGVGAHTQSPPAVRPAHQPPVLVGQRGLDQRYRPEQHLAARTVDRDRVAEVHGDRPRRRASRR